SKYKDSSFIPNWELPHKIWGKDGGMYRLKYWHKPICKRRFFIPVPRKFPGNLTPYGGSMFWCLNREVVRYVINYVDKFQKEVSFFKNVWIPDEIFIPTVVMNSPFKSTCINENLIYIRWSILGSPHPDYLDASDANEIKKAGSEPSIRGGKSRIKLFARKIDASKGIPLMNILDNET
ncbi:MAG: beta-1,6-N-acetylglucosaminyltransferase, partial [Methylotenera sp.]